MAPTPADTPARTIRLHSAQRDFLRSDALFRAFCGGIGSGKSWAGSYDLIRRAKAGHLYLVCAPTYAMLSDATFRMFLSLASDLGIIDPSEVKRSAPPSIRLRTGAEVLFRSADEPDRLRGPNLSGIWMDEASLMGLDAFTVLIGRLREQGEQGWLSATFTPKGRQHWTFATFASGRPNTALYRARTTDNPFLPAGFHDTVRGQYTSTLAAQELEGEFLDEGGLLFRRSWFPLVDAAPAGINCVRAWDLAATAPKEGKDPDFTAGVLLGRQGNAGDFFVLDVQRTRNTPQAVERLIQHTAAGDGRGTAVSMEQEPGSAGVALADRYARLLAGYRFKAERATGDKMTRALPLAASAEAGLVKLVRGRWVEPFLDELEIFPLGDHDDQVDAAALAFTRLIEKRRFHFLC
jgi:predicted phage terminase large subunit-like protein